MPKPQNKSQLVQAANTNFEQLVNLIENLSTEIQKCDFPPGTLNRNIRDVLAHLHHWHVMLLDWYTVGMEGEKPDMPAKGYTWEETKALNEHIQKKYSDHDLNDIKEQLNASFIEVLEIIEKHSDEELFEKKRYHWTGSTSLGAYLISNTSSHYHWGYTFIKKQLKTS